MKKWFLLSAFVASFAHAGPSLSDQVNVTTLPGKPIVLLSDTQEPTGHPVKGPWFGARIEIDNQSSQPVTIVSLQFEVQSASAGGLFQSFDPSHFDITVHCGQREIRSKFNEFGTFLPGDRGNLRLTAQGLPVDCDPGAWIPTFMVGNLPGTNYSYFVKIRLLGWFGTYNNPSDRFDKTVGIYTM